VFYKVGLGEDERFGMVIGYTSRRSYGRNRRRINVGIETGKSYRALIEFFATDDYAKTGDCMCILKRPNTNEWLPTTEPIPFAYAGHRVVIFERFIRKGGGEHWGVLVNEGEIDDMLRIALIRAEHKGL
jgi:hypothetical protein